MALVRVSAEAAAVRAHRVAVQAVRVAPEDEEPILGCLSGARLEGAILRLLEQLPTVSFTNELVVFAVRFNVLSDGGAFLRTGPSKKGGGKWTSLAGDTAAMEFVEAKFAKGRWVGGAQDNTVQLSNGSATDPAIGYIFGDGTVVDIDAVSGAAPRYWGCTQVTCRHCHLHLHHHHHHHRRRHAEPGQLSRL